ncbi:NitT/TauT family transport system permease protein [Halarchaeum solikamskense]|uniref:ABC transporter permease n=1 Tax=Halarchaeum nitratireducens TaxID=489913 RepID=UPI001B3ABA61|nr:NitT/TauT family transport system permease protein [Halarchaeum solikamskense]
MDHASEPATLAADGSTPATTEPMTAMNERVRYPLFGVGSLALAWELLARLVVDGLTPLSDVFAAGVGLVASGELFGALAASLPKLALGYGLAVAVGVPLGLLMGFSSTADALADTPVTTLFVTSVASLLPLLIAVFGAGIGFYVVVVFLFAVFHVTLTLRAGVRDVDDALVETGRVFGASRFGVYRHVLLPASLPHVAAALRLGAVRAVKGMVVGELWVYAGFGSLLHGYQRYSQTDSALAVVLVLMALSVGIAGGLGALERRYAPWHHVEGGVR